MGVINKLRGLWFTRMSSVLFLLFVSKMTEILHNWIFMFYCESIMCCYSTSTVYVRNASASHLSIESYYNNNNFGIVNRSCHVCCMNMFMFLVFVAVAENRK